MAAYQSNDIRGYDLTMCLRALSDSVRQDILTRLLQSEMSVSELTECCSVAQPTVSYHLAVLWRANLVVRRRSGKQSFYRANTDCIGACCRDILAQYTESATESRPAEVAREHGSSNAHNGQS